MTEEDRLWYLDSFAFEVVGNDKSMEHIKNHLFYSFDVSNDEKIVLLFDDDTVGFCVMLESDVLLG